MQVYKIINSINGKIYVGKDEHNRKNYLGSGKLIKQAIKKYGYQHFKKEILQECYSKEELCKYEIFWINELNSISPNGYNICFGGNGGDTTSFHPNKQEIIEKRRKSNIGKKRSPEFCALMKTLAQNVDPNVRKDGCRKAVENRKKRIKEIGYTEKEILAHKKFREKLIEYNKSYEGRKRVSKQFKGKKKPAFSEEHRRNIGLASKGRKIPGKSIIINDVYYESLHDAHRKLNIPLMTIRNRLINKNFPSWNYNLYKDS
jgi:hypothetical protein